MNSLYERASIVEEIARRQPETESYEKSAPAGLRVRNSHSVAALMDPSRSSYSGPLRVESLDIADRLATRAAGACCWVERALIPQEATPSAGQAPIPAGQG